MSTRTEQDLTNTLVVTTFKETALERAAKFRDAGAHDRANAYLTLECAGEENLHIIEARTGDGSYLVDLIEVVMDNVASELGLTYETTHKGGGVEHIHWFPIPR